MNIYTFPFGQSVQAVIQVVLIHRQVVHYLLVHLQGAPVHQVVVHPR